MDPTHKKHPKFTTVKPHRHHHHPLPDPTIVPPPSTIQNISHRFSKLYVNHKKLVGNSLKFPNVNGFSHPTPHPEPDTDLQTKTLSLTTLTKSNSHHERKINLDLVKVVNVKDNDEIKKPSLKKNSKNLSLEDNDVKKASQVMCKSLEREKLKRFGKGIEVKDNDEIKKPSLKNDLKIPSFQEYDVKKTSKLSLESEKMKGFGEEVEVKRLSVSSIPMVNGRRRKSFCSSQAELADFFSCTGVKVVAVDMPPFMQIHAVDCARKTHDSLEKFTSRTLALKLKKEFDGVYGPAWHCIVGTSFGSFVTHSVGGFMYFSMDHKLYILLFKTTVRKAD